MSKGNNNSIPQEINQQQIHTGDESIPEEIDKSSDKYTSIPESIAGSTDHSLNVAPISESDHQSVSNHGSVDDLSMRDLMKKLTDLREKNEIQRLQQRQNKIDLTKSMARELLSKRQKKLDWERKMKAEVEKINRVLDKALATDASLSSISLLSEGEQQIIGVDVQHTKCDSVSSNGQSLLPDVKQVLASDRSDKPAVPTDDDTSAGEISEGIPAIDDNNIIEEQIDISVQSASRDSSSIREELEGGSARTAASSISEQIEPLAIQKSTSSLVKIPSTSSSAGLSDSQLALTFAELSGKFI
jgi:vacuolar-type H+-ATPase subunit I/STV1